MIAILRAMNVTMGRGIIDCARLARFRNPGRMSEIRNKYFNT